MSKVVVITGASAGVGRATAREFAWHGYKVGLIARNRAALENAKLEVDRLGGEGLVMALDVSNAQAVELAAAEIEQRLGPIDVWVNVAMVSVFSPVKEMEVTEYQRVTDVTYLGYVYGTLAALRRMLPRDRGTIVQVGSALAYRSIPLQSAYCAAKHAIVGFTDSLRCELYHDKSNVHVTVVQMPALNTPQFGWVKSRLPRHPQPVPPIFQPEVAARAIYYAAHARHREMWVGSPTVAAILGQKVIPGMLDRYLGATGYESQQTDEPADPQRPNNLWEYVPGDAGAHGTFDSRSRENSLELQLSMRRNLLLAGAAGLGALVAWAWKAKARRSRKAMPIEEPVRRGPERGVA